MADKPTRTPPYISFRTFWNFIQELHEHQPLPQIIDTSVLGTNRSGASRSQLLVALRFFELIDSEKRPTHVLQELVQQPEPEVLRRLLEKHYADVIALDLRTAAGSQLDNALRELGSGQGATLRKARTFFLAAAEEAGIELGRAIKKAPPTPPRQSRRRNRSKTETPPPTAIPAAEFSASPSPRTGGHPLIQGLLMQLPEEGESWTKEERERWLTVAGGVLDMLYDIEATSPSTSAAMSNRGDA